MEAPRAAGIGPVALHGGAVVEPLQRDRFLRVVDRALRRRRRHRGSVGIVAIELGGFEALADHGGHLLSDEAFTAAVRRLDRVVAPTDVLARLDRSSFAVLCGDAGPDSHAPSVAERTLDAFTEPVDVRDDTWHVKVAVGVSIAVGSDDDPAALLARARDAAGSRSRPSPAASRAAREDDHGRHLRVARIGAARPAAATEVPLDVADATVRLLFDVALDLASCASVAKGPLGQHLTRAIDNLDRAIRLLRSDVFDRLQTVLDSIDGSLGHGAPGAPEVP